MAAWQQMLCVLVAIAAIVIDTQQRRIPNTIVVAGLIAGTILQVMEAASGIHAAMPSIAGLLLGLVAFLPLYAMRMMGAGDVKLFATFGFLLGWTALLPIWLLSCLSLTLHTGWIASREWLSPSHSQTNEGRTLGTFRSRLGESIRSRNGMPYGAHLGIATIFHICTGGAYAIF